MSTIRPRDPQLLTDEDVEYAYFHCCGDEDLVFLRCPECGHIWVQCYECETWYTDLMDLQKRASSCSPSMDQLPSCPHCLKRFADYFYLKEGIVDKYLPSAGQVIQAGFGKYLSHRQREKLGVDSTAT